jgi:hypothetical protein
MVTALGARPAFERLALRLMYGAHLLAHAIKP